MSDDLLHDASSRAFAQLEAKGGDLHALSVPLQTLVAIYSAQGIVDNGGFQYFFESDWKSPVPYSFFADAYRRIGAADIAECYERAAAIFTFADPHLHEQARNDFMDQLDRQHEFFQLGERVCGDESVWAKLEAYVSANMAAFRDAP
jgi:hypothetical protein